jgi:F0F1-type ATP synthase assembly protein I
MTQSLMSRDKSEAKKKGTIALAAWVGSGVLFWHHWPIVGLAAVGGAAYLTFKWFMFRAKRGMRF